LRLIHGFPGDNPVGIVLHFDNIMASVGELAQDKYQDFADAKEIKEVIDWYNSITKESCRYHDRFWYNENS
jgi:hypothetical protein